MMSAIALPSMSTRVSSAKTRTLLIIILGTAASNVETVSGSRSLQEDFGSRRAAHVDPLSPVAAGRTVQR